MVISSSLLYLLCLCCSSMSLLAQAELFPISDESYPHLVITDPSNVPVTWHKKSIAFRLANSAAVRINSRWCQHDQYMHAACVLVPRCLCTLSICMQNMCAVCSHCRLTFARGIRFIPSTHTLHLSTQKGFQESLDPIVNTFIAANASLDQRWWNDDGPALSTREKQLVDRSSAINRWRSVACIPAR